MHYTIIHVPFAVTSLFLGCLQLLNDKYYNDLKADIISFHKKLFKISVKVST